MAWGAEDCATALSRTAALYMTMLRNGDAAARICSRPLSQWKSLAPRLQLAFEPPAGLSLTDPFAVMCPEACSAHGVFTPGCAPPSSPPSPIRPAPPPSPPQPPRSPAPRLPHVRSPPLPPFLPPLPQLPPCKDLFSQVDQQPGRLIGQGVDDCHSALTRNQNLFRLLFVDDETQKELSDAQVVATVCLKPIGIIARVFNGLYRQKQGGREFGETREWAGLARADQFAVMCPETCGEYGVFAPGCTPPPSPPSTPPPLPPLPPAQPPHAPAPTPPPRAHCEDGHCVGTATAPPPSSPIAANSRVHPHWVLLPVFVLLACCFAAMWRRHHRLLQDRANLRISRDRAQVDLQMHLQQAQKVQINTDGSFSSSTKRARCLPSLPPGPPSSAGSDKCDTGVAQRTAESDMDVDRRSAGSDVDMAWLYGSLNSDRRSGSDIEMGGPIGLQLPPTSMEAGRPACFLAAPSSPAPASSSGPVRVSVQLEELATLAEMAGDAAFMAGDAAPSSRAPASSSGPERGKPDEMASALAEMVNLMADDETVAALQVVISPGRTCDSSRTRTTVAASPSRHAGTGRAAERAPVAFPWAAHLRAGGGATPGRPNEPIPPPPPASLRASAPFLRTPTAPLSYLDLLAGALRRHSARPVALPPAAAPPVTSARPVALPYVAAPAVTQPASPVALSTPLAAPSPLLPANLAVANSSIFLQNLSDFGADVSELHSVFARLLTPKVPGTLPKSLWLSYTQIFSIVQPYAPGRVWQQGRGNLMQRLIQWCQHQPAFTGRKRSAWCARMKEFDEGAQKKRAIHKFCLEYNQRDA